MEIKFNDRKNTIEIKDGLKSYYFLLKTLMLIILLNSILNLLDITKASISYTTVVWAALGSFSVVYLYVLIFKKTTQEEISIDEIQSLKEKSFLGKKKFYIVLNNKKERILNSIKSQEEFNTVKKMFAKIGIKD